jgi:carbon monoxide dehydrogenase subunit G
VKLENTFTVPVAIDTAWQVLLDVERIAPCMPGATLTGQDGDTFTGNVKVKVGPISLTYGGTATITSRDETNHVATIEAAGKETRGSGTAKAIITAHLNEHDGSTEVAVETDLTITGKPAQFGRGVMAEISGKLITAFADCLATTITADGARSAAEPAQPATPAAAARATTAPATPATSATSAASATPLPPRPAASPPAPEAIDLLGTAALPILKRIGPIAILVGLIALLIWRRGH